MFDVWCHTGVTHLPACSTGSAVATMGRCNPLATVHSAVTGTVDWCVGGLGVQAGRRPWLVASLAVVLAASCALGTLIHFEYATDAEKIW